MWTPIPQNWTYIDITTNNTNSNTGALNVCLLGLATLFWFFFFFQAFSSKLLKCKFIDESASM